MSSLCKKGQAGHLKVFKKEVDQKHRHNFGAYVTTTGRKGKRPLFERQPAAKRSKQASWTHNFVCLANSNQTKPPTAGWERELFLEAGLGEKKISFSNIDCSPKEYRDKLCSVFPKLMEAGGFEFMRCCSNSCIYVGADFFHCYAISSCNKMTMLGDQKCTFAQSRKIFVPNQLMVTLR